MDGVIAHFDPRRFVNPHSAGKARGLTAAAALAVLWGVSPPGPLAHAASEGVRVPSLDRTGNEPVMLPASWYPVPAAEPAPAMVLLHGCGGQYDRKGRLALRYTEIAARLNAMGVHALVPDSLTPRGEKELCTQRIGERRITQTHRRRDALGALQWLAAQQGVDPARLGLLGWSNGGSTVLSATNLKHAESARASPPASLAVALYPGCRAELKRGYRPAAPLLMLLGEADDWTPAAECKLLAAAAEQGAAPAPEIESYDGAHHGFDGTAPVRLRRDVPNGAHPGKGVHVGGHPAARAAAAERLAQFLRRHWKLAP